MKNYKSIILPLAISVMFTRCSKQDEVLPKSTAVPESPAPAPATVIVPSSASCKKILIDGSHDGGGWWFPQGPVNDNPKAPHQGSAFAQMLKDAGFEVDELSRGLTITDETLKGYGIIIRTGGFAAYSQNELLAYQNILDQGVTLLLITDHKKYNPSDKLEEMLGVLFKGIAFGTVSKFSDHPIVKGVTSYNYNIAGSAITNSDINKNIEPVGWLSDNDHVDYNFNGIIEANEPGGMPVMAILHHDRSRIFLIGDINELEAMPQPFTDNLVKWISDCNGTL